MEFTGSIQFADESSWLTLTTESDDVVTIKVTVNFSGEGSETTEFTVTPNDGVARLPIGEILRSIITGYHSGITCTVTATQGSASCRLTGSRVFPCRKFTLANVNASIFSDKPKMIKAFDAAPDKITVFCGYGASITVYARLVLKNGSDSSYFRLDSTSSTNGFYRVDVSLDSVKAKAMSNGLSTDFVAYKVWMTGTLGTSEIYTFEVEPPRLQRKTYKFLGRKGTYEYIHATGKFSRSIESETQVLVTAGVEEELANDSTMNFEQNSGHVESAGMCAYWLEFLASKERYITEKDGSERAIIVDEFKTSLTDHAVSSLTFKWHYANPSNTTIDRIDIPLTGLTISGVSTVNNDSNTAQFSVGYTPSNTTQRGVTWSITSGSAYASIDQRGLLTVKNGANANNVTIKATSSANSSISATKSVSVTYKAATVAVTGVKLNKTALSLSIGDSETLVATVLPESATDKSVVWASSAPSIATADQNGKVTAKAAGVAVITVKTNDGSFAASCNLSVAAALKYYTLTVNCATSGATVKVLEYVTGQTNVQDAVDYTGPMTFKENTTVKVWCHKNGMIDSGTQSIQMTSDKTVTVACKSYPSWNLGAEFNEVADGASITPVVTDPDNVGWRLISGAEWIKVSTDGSSFEIAANTSTATRTGDVSLVCDEVSLDAVVASCTIRQAASASSLPTWNLPGTYAYDKDGTNYPDVLITDEDNAGWELEIPDWIQTEGGMTSGTGSFSLMIIAEVNTGASRSGVIRLKSAGGSETFAICFVTQEAGDAFKLPDGYTKLDYIASKGTVGSLLGDLPYIDTGISDYSDLTYHVEYTVFPNSESGLSLTTYPFIMGSLSERSTGATVTQIFTGNFPGGNSSYGTSGMTGDQSGSWSGARNITNNITLFGVLPAGVRHTLEWNFDQGYVVVDGDASVGKIVGAETSVSTTGNSCFLFAINAAGSPVYSNGNDTRRGWQKLHRFWIKDSLGNEQCDLIPARNSSGTVGMYDMIRKQFLTSANSVPFTGPEDDSSVKTTDGN